MKLWHEIKQYQVPVGHVGIWWVGQASHVVKTPAGVIIAIDPYLSNSCKKLGDQIGFDMDRLSPPLLAPSDLIEADLYLLTHSHQDHLDPETLEAYRQAGGVGPYLAPAETVEKLKELNVPSKQITMMWPNKSHVIGDVTLQATFAIPLGGDDLTHVGYLLFLKDGPTVYFTGDTGYHEVLGESVAPHHPDVMVTVINPFGNLDPGQAARLARRIQPKVVIPSHYDLFPDNNLPPRLLRTNLLLYEMQDRYRELTYAKPYLFPEESS